MDDITDAILTNPELLERAQGREDWIITMRDDGKYGVWDGRCFHILTHEQLYPSVPFHEQPAVKAYLETLYH